MYTQYFFKFASQEEMHTVLTGLEWYGEVGVSDGESIYGFTLSGHEGSLDEVGTIVDTPAVYDEETFEEVTPATYIDGWHLNAVLNIDLPEELQAYQVTPATPARIFAGFSV
jgi:hypothetical protein